MQPHNPCIGNTFYLVTCSVILPSLIWFVGMLSKLMIRGLNSSGGYADRFLGATAETRPSQGNGGDKNLAYLRFHMKLHLGTLTSFARDGPRMRCVLFVDISENEESSGKFVEASGEEPVSATAGGRPGLDRQDPEIAIQQPYVTRLHLQIRRRHPTPDRQNVYFVATYVIVLAGNNRTSACMNNPSPGNVPFSTEKHAHGRTASASPDRSAVVPREMRLMA